MAGSSCETPSMGTVSHDCSYFTTTTLEFGFTSKMAFAAASLMRAGPPMTFGRDPPQSPSGKFFAMVVSYTPRGYISFPYKKVYPKASFLLNEYTFYDPYLICPAISELLT